ncbi:MAG: inosine/xanthosine triphosphatase [Bacteroidota bacterium]
MKLIIASTRTPKINGVKKAVIQLSTIFQFDPASVEYETKETTSGVSDMPISIEETMLGSRQRASSVFRKDGNDIVFSVGVEGGLFRNDNKVFLQSWTCAFDGERYHYGSSGAIEIPDALADKVMNLGIELGIAIDEFAKQADVRSRQGTFGILTNDLITREDSFAMATMFALIPFLNRNIYSHSRNK